MKKLIVSIKTSQQVFDDFKRAYKKAKAGKLKPEFHVSFSRRKEFNRFVENIHVLMDILEYKPKSVYELAKLSNTDVSNLNKIILFFEDAGVIRIEEKVVSGRRVRRPIVEYDRVEFRLAG